MPHAYRCGALPVPQAAAVRQRASAAEALPQPGAARLPSSHLHLSLTPFTVCTRVGVMYGASVVSGHFGDVVLWELSPPAAGEVLIRSEPELPGRPSAAVVRELALIMRTTRTTTFCPRILQHPLRSRDQRWWRCGRGREPTLRRRCDPLGAGALGLGD